MRRRFFVFLFSMIAGTVLVVSFLQYSFFQSERKALIDRQIETVASDLIASGLSIELLDNLDVANNIIENAVKGDRIDQIVNIYSEDSDVLYSNETAKRLNLELHKERKWEDFVTHDHTVRMLTMKNGELYIQVGLVLDSTLHRWAVGHKRFLYFLMSILVLVVVVSYFSARFLFSPIQRLATEFHSLSENLQRQLGQPLNEFIIPTTLQRYSELEGSPDELQSLGRELKNFLGLLSDYTRSFQAQTALLSHEIKTPLTVIINRLEEMNTSSSSKELIAQATAEAYSLAGTVNSYLQWAVFTSAPGKPEDLYAVKLKGTVTEVAAGLNLIYKDRLQLGVLEEQTVFAMPEHIKQVLKNLFDNALKYSSETAKVFVEIEHGCLRVRDQGPGIPEVILKSVGSPFNKTKGFARSTLNASSSGLGLAWVQAICRKYEWPLSIESTLAGTLITINFQAGD